VTNQFKDTDLASLIRRMIAKPRNYSSKYRVIPLDSVGLLFTLIVCQSLNPQWSFGHKTPGKLTKLKAGIMKVPNVYF